MEITVGRILSVLIALGYATYAAIDAVGVTLQVIEIWVVLLLPLALIWFPDALGSWTYFTGLGATMGTETHPAIVSSAGWFFLVGAPVLIGLASYCCG